MSEVLVRFGSAVSGVTVGSPIDGVEERFLALAGGVRPLTLPAELVCAEPVVGEWPVDRVRVRLAHPATSPSQRSALWREVVRRSASVGAPWDVVAVAMAVPAVRRMVRRQALPGHLERSEVEQAALVGVASALTEASQVECAEPDRLLFNAADREVHRLIDGARRRARREIAEETAFPAAWGWSERSGDEDEFGVLARAVQVGVLRVDEARLIARTRVDGESVKVVAAQRGVGWRSLYRHRRAAEEHLAEWLRGCLRQD